MFSFRKNRLVPALLLATGFLTAGSAAADVEAIKGKRYSLDKIHGPWMVMVASLRDVPEGERKQDGLTAWEAADQLVYELRLNGIPAYTYLQDQEFGQLNSSERRTDEGSARTYIARQQFIAVLAHSFSSPDDKEGRAVLDFVKNHFEPSVLKDKRNGGIFALTPGRPRALSRALIVPNPLRPPDEMRQRGVDPVVKQLNAGSEYSLLKNKGKYTLVVATFIGNAVLQVGHQSSGKALSWFEQQFGDTLDQSGTDAWQVTQALRSASKFGYDHDYEAWVYHDRHKSVVSIGSFDDPNDPRIRHLAQEFSSKPVRNPETGEEVMTAEIFTIPKNPPSGSPDRFWVMDIRPTLIQVPNAR